MNRTNSLRVSNNKIYGRNAQKMSPGGIDPNVFKR